MQLTLICAHLWDGGDAVSASLMRYQITALLKLVTAKFLKGTPLEHHNCVSSSIPVLNLFFYVRSPLTGASFIIGLSFPRRGQCGCTF